MNTVLALSVVLLGFLYKPSFGNLGSGAIREYCEDYFGDEGLLLWKQDSCTIRCRYENSQQTMYVQDGSDCSPGNTNGTHACWDKACRKLSTTGNSVCGSLNTKKAFVVDNNTCLVQCVASDGTLGDPVPVPYGTKCLYQEKFRGQCKNGECYKRIDVLSVGPTDPPK